MATDAVMTEEQQPTFEDLELLVEVSKLLTLHDLEEVMQDVMSLAAKAVGASKASLFLYDGSSVNWDHIFTSRNLEQAESIRVVSQVLDKGLAGWVIHNRTGAIVSDTESDDRWHVFPDDELTVRSAMCAPLVYNKTVIAVLTLVHPEPGVFTSYHLRLLTLVANQATVAIQNTQLFKRLIEKQHQLEAVLQSVPDVLMVLNESGEFITLNEGACQLLEINNNAYLNGHTFAEYSDQMDVLQKVQQTLSDLDTDKETTGFEVHSFDTERDYVVQISHWEDNTSQSGGVVVIMHDVTTLRDLFRFKDEMLRIVSHDLRSPLAIIAGYVDMMQYDIEPTNPSHEYIGAINRSIKRMNDLLEDLLQVRQIDEKGLRLDADVAMIDLVHPVIQSAMMLAQQKNQTVVREVQIDETLIGTVDTTLVRQAMENLVSNAVKYTEEGGQITLRAFEEDNALHFEVEDNGIGIPEESIPYLFESFYRVNPNSNTTISGAGLGLSLVKSIAERHQGQILVQSEEGVGSVFKLIIPLRQTKTRDK